MKKILNNKKILVIIIIGIIVLSGITYVAAKTLINSKDVIYTDTYKLGAENVQDAIDGTCSNIDKRLSAIEDKLYTITDISGRKPITTSTDFVYTGASITLPAKSYCSITVGSSYGGAYMTHITLSGAPDLSFRLASNTVGEQDETGKNWGISATYTGYIENELTIYVIASHNRVSEEIISYYGFCATKYK